MFKTKPFYPKQGEIYEASKDMPAAALLMDMGTGKSWEIINTACHLYKERKIDCLLIVCSKGVLPVWPVQLAEHTWDQVMLRIAVCRAESLARPKGPEQKLLLPSYPKEWAPLRVAILPVSLLSTKNGMEYARQFLISGKSMMAIDESTSIKTPPSKCKRTKAAIALGPLAAYRRIATGMPVTQSPLDLWAQFEFLQKGCLGFGSYYSFRAQFANIVTKYKGTRAYPKVAGYRSLDLLQQRIAPLSFRVTKTEALPDLPEKLYTTYQVDLTPEQKKMYEDMRKHAVAQWSCGAEVSAPIALTQIMRMQQILCGYSKEDEGAMLLPVKSNRLDALMELLEGVSGKVIIWCPFTWAIHNIMEEVEKVYGHMSCGVYYGETASPVRPVVIDRFQNDPACRFFVSNPSTGGVGLTLTAAHTVIYYANSHSVEHRVQSEDRAHRIGQHNAVTYIDMVAAGTVDEKILKALREKRSLADMIVNGGIESLI